ncbi:sensor histidine kinase [Micromonospora lupini]|uniref:sensor histidine kinase n=1 Tax=Micromonospora lupini TaxID=285679 RepID=UPI0031CDC37F
MGLRRAGRRYAAAIRMITLPVATTVAIAAAGDPHTRAAAALAWTAVGLWSIVYVPFVIRTHLRWPTVVDGLVLTALAIATPWTVPQSWLSTGKSWVVPFCTFACVAYQYYERWALGGGVAVAVAAGMVTGTAVGRPDGAVIDGLITACWSLVVTALARLLWTLVHRGGAQADAAVADAAVAAREREVSARIRVDELFTNRKLHDTSATTLLLAGLGQTGTVADLMSKRAKRDLEFLRVLRSNVIPPQSDLIDLLRDVADVSPLHVRWIADERASLDAVVAHALADAAGEALTNTARHSGATAVTLSVSRLADGVRVEVCDAGRGFDLAAVPSTRRGVRESIIDRVNAAGGVAVVESIAGRGTIVRLEWHRA